MSRHFFFLINCISVFFLFSPAPAQSALIAADSCSLSDVRAAYNAASDGDVVSVPAGNCTWGGTFSFSKDITLSGAGRDRTFITFSSSPGINLTADASSGQARITGFTFRGQGPGIEIRNSDLSGFRIDNNTFDELSGRSIYTREYDDGLIDNNIFYLVTQAILNRRTSNEGTREDSYWSLPTNLGETEDILFIEHNEFTWMNNNSSRMAVVDMETVSRTTFRYNTVTGSYIVSHNTGQIRNMRGMRQCEIYENTFNMTGISWYTAMHVRGGTGVVFNNTINSGYDDGIKLDITRTYEIESNSNMGRCTDVTPSGVCSNNRSNYCNSDSECGGGTCQYYDDPTGDGIGYPCVDQLGRGSDSGLGTVQALEPLYFWNNKTPTGEDHSIYNTAPSGFLEEGRDYFVGIEKPGYTPFPDPHPLAIGAPTPQPPVAQ